MLINNLESLAYSQNTDKELAYDESVRRNIKVIRNFIYLLVRKKINFSFLNFFFF